MRLTGTHDIALVFLSIVIAIFASFTALSLAGRIRASVGWARRLWLTAAAVALGGGIWSMHFVAMLAFSMPGMAMGYDPTLTLVSMLIAITFTGAGFGVISWESITRWQIIWAGLLMGLGVVAMHYVGMAAMRMTATLSYEGAWLGVSVLIAIVAATAAISLVASNQTWSYRLAASGFMGLAIAGMHYAGMRAAVFTMNSTTHLTHEHIGLDQHYLALLISAVTVLILLVALGAAWLERLFHGFARREARIALRLQVADVLRDRSTDEALTEVAALMGQHFGVTRTGYGELDAVEDIFDYDVCWTDGSVPPLLGRLPAADFGVKIVAALNAGETVVVNDLFEADLSDEARTRQTASKVDTRSILVVPFVRGGRLRTIVYLNDRQPRQWHREDIAFMEELADRTRLVIERAAVEEELRDLNANLEARVEARTRDLREAQEALLQSQKMEAMGQLVAGLAHDFNNVLGAMIGSFDLIQRRADQPDRVRRFAEAGLQAGERGAKLTGQLLAFSRSQRIQLEPLYMCDVVEELVDLLASTLGPMIALDLELDPSPVAVMGDPTQIEMTILNLAINARDAMPDGGKLRIATAVCAIAGDQELIDGNYVELAVTDTGAGMDEATLNRAMEPFFTTKPVGKGTGLGLAQIYGSARQAGGTVRIVSAPGQGTTVRVILPCTNEQPRRAVTTAGVPSALPRQATTILLVDDDNDLRSILASAMESQGFKVTEAIDGSSALTQLYKALPDLAIIDFAMPGMNGAELAKRISERWPALPILFASGFSDTDALEAVTGGRAKLLRKPFRVDELLHALNSMIAADMSDQAVSLGDRR